VQRSQAKTARTKVPTGRHVGCGDRGPTPCPHPSLSCEEAHGKERFILVRRVQDARRLHSGASILSLAEVVPRSAVLANAQGCGLSLSGGRDRPVRSTVMLMRSGPFARGTLMHLHSRAHAP